MKAYQSKYALYYLRMHKKQASWDVGGDISIPDVNFTGKIWNYMFIFNCTKEV